MERMLHATLLHLGNMFTICPAGQSPASRRLAVTLQQLRSRSDLAALQIDTSFVAQDCRRALARLAR
ncbi:hypothetical protein [Megalodesulfovibrio gigas]|uniref:hypothetical protein n=1 Tax=Megalodesulfovibrio gigas TaxID=879 RepID=UPI00040A2D11|nr:hypothetical protein [Megalodesulfovibrio gigas]